MTCELSRWGSEEDGQNGTATGAQWALGGDTVSKRTTREPQWIGSFVGGILVTYHSTVIGVS